MKKSWRKLAHLSLALILAAGIAVTPSGCKKKGPLEKAGEKADKALEKAGEAAEDVGEAAKDAGEKTTQAP